MWRIRFELRFLGGLNHTKNPLSGSLLLLCKFQFTFRRLAIQNNLGSLFTCFGLLGDTIAELPLITTFHLIFAHCFILTTQTGPFQLWVFIPNVHSPFCPLLGLSEALQSFWVEHLGLWTIFLSSSVLKRQSFMRQFSWLRLSNSSKRWLGCLTHLHVAVIAGP